MPNTVPAAGEAMPKITRRSILGGLAAIAAPTSVVAAAAPAKPAFDLQHWLDTADPVGVARYHANCLADVMSGLHPDRDWRSHVDHKHGFALIVGDPRKDEEAGQ